MRGRIGAGETAEGAAGKGEAVRVMRHAVEDGVSERGVADHVVPVLDGQLAGNERGATAGAIVDEFEQIAPSARACTSSSLKRPGKRT